MRTRIPTGAFLVAAAILVMAPPAMAAKNLVAKNCIGCHQSDGSTIWGTIVPGSQTDSTVEVSTGRDVWKIRYDKQSSLDSFSNVRELRDEKAVSVEFRQEGNGLVYAEEISYKPGYHFHTMDHVITISEVGQVIKETPEQGNYMIVDARGYDNFIEGHLPYAVNIPYYRLLEFKDRLPEDTNTQIIAYCRGFT